MFVAWALRACANVRAGEENSPCIIFIDEIDASVAARRRLGGGKNEREQT